MSKVKSEFVDGKFNLGVDLNEDGENSLNMKLNLNEAMQEAIKRGEAIEGAKLVDFKFELTKMVLILDTDKDGEPLLELVVDLPEVFDEVTK